MVDALREAWRVLSAHGILVDLRPLPSSKCPIEVVTPEEVIQVGVVDASGTVADDVAADRAVAQVVQDGRYLLRKDARLDFEFSWDTVGEMASFMEESRRMRNIRPSYIDLEKLHREWRAKAGGRVRLRCRRIMLLAVYQKTVDAQGIVDSFPAGVTAASGRSVGSFWR